MKIKLLAIGKTDSRGLAELIDNYAVRLKRFISFEIEIIPDIKNSKNLSETEQKRKEATVLQSKLNPGDTVILLDERGKEYSSVEFARFLQQQMNSGVKQLVFVIGGPYGVDQSIIKAANASWSLSRLTFSHQMIRLFAVEQLYRGMSILKNHPYHHQ